MTEVFLSSQRVQNTVEPTKNPLIISPNLDALLDFDERTRRRNASCPKSTFGVVAGLPPPPRGPRKMPTVARSPQSARFARVVKTSNPVETTATPAPSSSNPYINPAPTLDVVLKAEAHMISPTSRLAEARSINMDSTINPVTEPRSETQPQNSPLSADARVSGVTPTRHHKTYQSLQFNSRNIKQLGFSLSAPHRAIAPPSHFHDRPRSKGKPQVQKDTLPNPMAEVNRHLGDDCNDSLEVALPAGATGLVGLPPLLSHDRRNLSSLSLSTGSTNSTHEPPSTTGDPRISISSTIYTQSSHSLSLYSIQHHNPPAFAPELMSSSPYHNFQNRRRRSCIGLTSKPGNDFSCYANHNDFLQPTDALTKLDPHANTSGDARSQTLPPLISSHKPPLPNSPKPNFNRSPGQISSPKRQHDISHILTVDHDQLPPTTNFLDPDKRAELIKKSRKLTQVFGETPVTESFAPQHEESLGYVTFPSAKNLKINPKPWPPSEETRYLSANGRRHSTPLTPDEFSFLALPTDDEISLRSGSNFEPRVSSDYSALHDSDGNQPLTGSFMDLSDCGGPNGHRLNDNASSVISKKRTNRRAGASSPSAPSFFEDKTPVELAEAERRRKREKLAKVHRFLGSHVPTDLLFGLRNFTPALTGVSSERIPLNILAEHDVNDRKDWMWRRRSSPAIANPNSWSDDVDRLKEDLNGKEKAINVRRAVKMEKVFGVQPPQTLYHTRQSPSPTITTQAADLSARNINQSAYAKLRIRKTTRPGTSESNKKLLADGDGDYPEDRRPESPSRGGSNVYTHYQHSLNSLNDIIDRDDKESLAELHQYLQQEDSSSLQEFSRENGRRRSISASIAERRRSFPTRTPSLLSLSSEYTVTSIKPEVTDFELRRRRAVKLTQFFGVDYRTLVKDVLESIEKGVEDERNGGTLNPAEAEDLLQRLRRLRMKRGALKL